MDKTFVQGFMAKCAEAGVDPEALVKQSARGDQLLKLLSKIKKYDHTAQWPLPRSDMRDFHKIYGSHYDNLSKRTKVLADDILRPSSPKRPGDINLKDSHEAPGFITSLLGSRRSVQQAPTENLADIVSRLNRRNPNLGRYSAKLSKGLAADRGASRKSDFLSNV